MNQTIIKMPRSLAQDTFRNEWGIQLHSLEKSVHFLHKHLEAALEELAILSPASSQNTDFCKSEVPLVMQEAREAIRLLRLLSNTETHSDH